MKIPKSNPTLEELELSFFEQFKKVDSYLHYPEQETKIKFEKEGYRTCIDNRSSSNGWFVPTNGRRVQYGSPVTRFKYWKHPKQFCFILGVKRGSDSKIHYVSKMEGQPRLRVDPGDDPEDGVIVSQDRRVLQFVDKNIRVRYNGDYITTKGKELNLADRPSPQTAVWSLDVCSNNHYPRAPYNLRPRKRKRENSMLSEKSVKAAAY
ncbi:unnamed protein product [Clavelina lepadiformis]|uniref:Uncharacterized protein n=1 Tax=Clavelina lepadiformis TaxID=159417 RepID=A0ABP0FD17_CLALP